MAHRLVVIVVIKAHKPSKDTRVTFARTLDFVPWEGLTFVLSSEDETSGDIMEIKLEDIKYENASRTFLVELEDDSLYESLRERPESIVLDSRIAERVDYYKQFGWE